jgi:hypothetical protein
MLVPARASYCRGSHWGSWHPRGVADGALDPFHVIPNQIGSTKNWVLQYKVHILHLCHKLILLLCLILTIVENCITGWGDTPWRWCSYSVKVLEGITSVAVPMIHVLQRPRQCGRQGSPTARHRDHRCSGEGGGSWGTTVLAATYRGLYQGCTKMAPDTVLIGCLLLQLWSYERFTIARTNIIPSPYDKDMYHDTQEDMPTMGTL